MRRSCHLLKGATAALALGVGFAAVASAADLGTQVAKPIYTKSAPVAGPSWYVFLDGTYDRVNLPTYSLGLHNVALGGLVDNGPVNNFSSTHLNGDGVRGGLGYFVPGTRWRLEASGSYVKADGTQTQSSSVTTIGFMGPVFLNGTTSLNAFGCLAAGATCSSSGQLNSDYAAWQANGKAAYDVQWAGPVVLSPFVAVFGGSSHNNQTFNQTFFQTVFNNSGSYAASTALTWNDFGGRFGLDATAPIANWVAWNFTGSVGLADRRVSLTGSDAASSTGGAVFNGASAISTSATTTAWVANVESGFSFKPMPSLTLRAFGGVNFDNRVPGISAPSYAGSILGPSGGTSSTINFSSETSYYGGGGVIWKF